MTGDSELFLALDQGGHSSRAMVFDQRGRCVAKAQVPIATHASIDQHSGEEHIEHSAQELADSLISCCDQIGVQLDNATARIRRAGLATQRSSIVGWQRSSGDPITPVISWQDRRAWRQTDALRSKSALISHLTGLVLSPHYGASKLRWCLDHDEAVIKARKAHDLTVGPLASFLARAITDSERDRCDPANASRTLLWDRHTRDWSPKLCELFGVDAALLPDSAPTRSDFGGVRVGAHTIALDIVTGDQSAAIYAFGQPEPGSAFINLGTGAFMQCPVGSQPVEANGLLNSVVFQDKHRLEYVLEGTVNGAGRALTWWSERCHKDAKSLLSAALKRQRDDAAFAERLPVFLNGVSGLGSPYWDSDFESRFIDPLRSEDTSYEPDAHHGALAIMESIAFLLAENLRVAQQTQLELSRLVLTGGLASVDPLCQTLADITGLVTTRTTLREATATGTGYLLANNPDWLSGDGQTQDSTVFQQDDNRALLARYSLWQTLMNRAQASRTNG